MSRQRLVLLGAIAIVALGIALIPNGGGAATSFNTAFSGQVKQNGAATTSITVYGCTAGQTTGTAPAISVQANSGSGAGNTGTNGDRITVLRGGAGGTAVTTINNFNTDTSVGSLTLPCSGSQTWRFEPRRNANQPAGSSTPFDVTINYVGTASSPP